MTLKSLFLILSLVCFATEAYGYKLFLAYPQLLTFWQAWRTCRDYNGHLAFIETLQENEQAVQAVKAVGDFGKGYFLGATDQGYEGRFLWIGLNKKVSYFNFAPGEPNNVNDEDCVALVTGGKWNDVQCEERRGFICAYDVK